MPETKTPDLGTLAEAYIRAHEARREAETQAEALKKAEHEIEETLLAAMQAQGLEAVVHAGMNVHVRVTERPRVEDEKRFFGWLSKMRWRKGLVKETIHAQTLGAWYREKAAEDPTFGAAAAKNGLSVFRDVRLGIAKRGG